MAKKIKGAPKVNDDGFGPVNESTELELDLQEEKTPILPPVNEPPVQEKKSLKIDKKDTPKPPQLFPLMEIARRRAIGFDPAWEPSILAFKRHKGVADLVTEDEAVSFLKLWGAKIN